MPVKALMVQGIASNVGKSILVASLCRIMRQDGWGPVQGAKYVTKFFRYP